MPEAFPILLITTGQPSNATTFDWDEWKAIIVDDEKERKRLRGSEG